MKRGIVSKLTIVNKIFHHFLHRNIMRFAIITHKRTTKKKKFDRWGRGVGKRR